MEKVIHLASLSKGMLCTATSATVHKASIAGTRRSACQCWAQMTNLGG